jgi:DNA mismatch repair protein MutH
MQRASPPSSETQLLHRTEQIAGLSIAELAQRLATPVPANSTRAKGFVGQLLEKALGANAGSLPEPDFREIGVELKTIPVSEQGKPFESTYVCTAELQHDDDPNWRDSVVCHKLSRVLWVPIITDAGLPPGQRHIGCAVLWSPSEDQQNRLRADWEELMDQIVLGNVEQITAHHGECLQIRPKAADSRARRWGVNEHGVQVKTLPRGFYLRTSFTSEILQHSYAGM